MAQILQLTGQLSFKPVITEEKEITANGTYTPTAGKDGFSKVTVNVSVQPELQELYIYNGDVQEYTPQAGFDGFSKVSLDAMPYQVSLSEVIAQTPYGSTFVQRGLYSELSIYNDVES